MKGSPAGITVSLVDSAQADGGFHTDLPLRDYSAEGEDWRSVSIPLADFSDSAQSWDAIAGRQKNGTIDWNDIAEVSFAIGPMPGTGPVEFSVKELRVTQGSSSTRKKTGSFSLETNLPPEHTIAGRRLIGYYPSWNAAYRAENIPFENLTHVFHAFIAPSPDGGVIVPSGFLEKELIILARKHGVRVIASIGGASSEASAAFRTIAASEALRKKFASELEKFLRSNGYDGVDLDWEFPESPEDRKNEVLLTAAIRSRFDSSPAPAPRWIITKAAPAGDWYGRWSDYSALDPYMDFYNLMTYDFHGGWSDHSGHNTPLFSGNDPKDSASCVEAVDYMTNRRKVPASKVNLGLAFFGHRFENSANLYDSCESGRCRTAYMNYSAILPLLKDASWQTRRDSDSMVPWLQNRDGRGIVVYDDEDSLREKIRWQAGRNLGGVFIWDISADFYDGTNRLLPSVRRSAEGK